MSAVGELYQRCARLGVELTIDADGDLAVGGPRRNVDHLLPEIRQYHQQLLMLVGLWDELPTRPH